MSTASRRRHGSTIRISPAQAVGAVMRALEKEPERRYRDAAEFAAALCAARDLDRSRYDDGDGAVAPAG